MPKVVTLPQMDALAKHYTEKCLTEAIKPTKEKSIYSSSEGLMEMNPPCNREYLPAKERERLLRDGADSINDPITTEFLSISKDNLNPEVMSNDAWFEIESKTLLTVYNRYGHRMAPEKFKEHFSIRDVKSHRVVRFCWRDDVVLELFHNRDYAFAKLYTGNGSLHGKFPKNPRQGDVISSWTEFKGSRDTRALPEGRDKDMPKMKKLPDAELVEFNSDGFVIDWSEDPYETTEDKREGLPEWLNDATKE